MEFVCTARPLPESEIESYKFAVGGQIDDFIGPDVDFLITPLKSQPGIMLTWRKAPDSLVLGAWALRCISSGLYLDLQGGAVSAGGYLREANLNSHASYYRGWAEPICELARTSYLIEMHGCKPENPSVWVA